jgi:hypothetical protein
MFLIDSSAWIEYLRRGGSQRVKARVRDVLQREEGVCCGVVIVELLRGARTEKDYHSLRESLSALPQLPINDDVIERAAEWGFLLDRRGSVVPTTDLLIAASAYKKACVLHTDTDFEVIAAAVGIEQEKVR